jgi:hypothetical protein
MSNVLTAIPRVVHPDDVYSDAVHVAGRDLHYVCGMCCFENVAKTTKNGNPVEGSFDLQRLIREEVGEPVKNGFCKYAEERLGRWLPWRVLHSTRGYCGSPGTVGTADGYCRVLWVLRVLCSTRSTRGYCKVLWVLWVLHGLK